MNEKMFLLTFEPTVKMLKYMYKSRTNPVYLIHFQKENSQFESSFTINSSNI